MIPRGKGPPASMPSMSRETFLAELAAKGLGKHLRANAFPSAAGGILESQNDAGPHGASCECSHLLERSVADHSRALALSFGVVFVDVKAAFALACRHLVLPGDLDDTSWSLQLLAPRG